MATQMQLARTLRKKKQQRRRIFFGVIFFVFTLTWITEKELERVIEKKGNEFRREKNIVAVRKREMLRPAR